MALLGTVYKLMVGKDYYQMLRDHTLAENAGHDTEELSSLSYILSAFCDAINNFHQSDPMDEIEKSTRSA